MTMRLLTLLLLVFSTSYTSADHWILVDRQGRIKEFTHRNTKPEAPHASRAWVYIRGDPRNPGYAALYKYSWPTRALVGTSQAEIDITTSTEALPVVKAKLLVTQEELSQAQLLEDPTLISMSQTKIDQLKTEYLTLKARAAGGN